MRRFLIKSTIFGSIVLILLTAMELGYRAMPNGYACKYQYLEQHAGERANAIRPYL